MRPGVYIYKDHAREILYVGKAKSLRDRVRSYFQPPVKLLPKTAKLVSLIKSIEYIEVGSEIEALLLEARLIQKFQPPFNIALKDGKSPYYIQLTREKFPKPVVNHEPKGSLAGPFLNGFAARSILRHLRRVVPFCTAKRQPGRACLYAHLGLCNPCPNASGTTVADYHKNIIRLKKMLTGKFLSVHSELQKQMAEYSKSLEFERASEIKKKIEHLDYLLAQPVRPEEYLINPNLVDDKRQESLTKLGDALHLENLSRIELYDIANIAGTAATAAMTVAIDGDIDSRNFRHFTIKTKNTPDDVGMLKEVLTRRLKRTDWPMPDLIVLDGGKSQLSIVNWAIPTIGLAKKEETLVVPAANGGFIELNLERTHPGLHLLQRLRDEAHRFSRRLHHKHRSKVIS